MGFLREERRAAGRAIVRGLRKLRGIIGRPPALPSPREIPARILIIRPYFLGDIVLSLPVAQALRRARPDARISWLCRAEWAPLLRGQAAVDEVIAWPKSGLREWRALIRFLRRRFDLVLALSWDRATPWIAWATGAPHRVGIEEFGRPRLSSLLHTHPIAAPERTTDPRPMADFYFEPLRLMGFGAREEAPRLSPTAEQEQAVVERLGALADSGYLLVHPGGRLRNKRWPLERLAELLRRLNSSERPAVVLVCGPGEEAWAADLARELPPGKGAFWPSPTLEEFIALVRRARLFLGNDSGPMHMAAAAGCRVVAVFGGDPRRWRPCGEGHRTVVGATGIESATVEAVFEAVMQTWASAPSR